MSHSRLSRKRDTPSGLVCACEQPSRDTSRSQRRPAFRSSARPLFDDPTRAGRNPRRGGSRCGKDPRGRGVQIFDVVDSLAARFQRIYLVDLDGVEENEPQLDYLQEISRDVDIWLDAGARTADEAIDALVTGASRIVLTSATLIGPLELERAWSLSQELAFEIELRGGRVNARSSDWSARILPSRARGPLGRPE